MNVLYVKVLSIFTDVEDTQVLQKVQAVRNRLIKVHRKKYSTHSISILNINSVYVSILRIFYVPYEHTYLLKGWMILIIYWRTHMITGLKPYFNLLAESTSSSISTSEHHESTDEHAAPIGEVRVFWLMWLHIEKFFLHSLILFWSCWTPYCAVVITIPMTCFLAVTSEIRTGLCTINNRKRTIASSAKFVFHRTSIYFLLYINICFLQLLYFNVL